MTVSVSSQVLTAILFNPYEDKPTFSLSPVLGSRGDFGFIPGLSSQLFSPPAFPFLFYSYSYESSLNGLIDLKESKDRSFICLQFFLLDFGCLLSSLFDAILLDFNSKLLTTPIIVFCLLPRRVLIFLPVYSKKLFSCCFFLTFGS